MTTLKNTHFEMQLQVENDRICTYIKQPHILSLLTADLKQKPYAYLQNTSISAQLAVLWCASAVRRGAPQMSILQRLLSFRRALTQSIAGLPPIKTKKSTPWHQKSGEITQ